MDWHELHKMKVDKLRELAKEKTNLEAVSGLSKDQLVEAIAQALGIPKPHKVVESEAKKQIKRRIHLLKGKRQEALDRRDAEALRSARREIHALKRRLRRMARVIH